MQPSSYDQVSMCVGTDPLAVVVVDALVVVVVEALVVVELDVVVDALVVVLVLVGAADVVAELEVVVDVLVGAAELVELEVVVVVLVGAAEVVLELVVVVVVLVGGKIGGGGSVGPVCEGWSVIERDTVAESLPVSPEASMAMLDAPAEADDEALRRSFDELPARTRAGSKLAFTPAGRPVALSESDCEELPVALVWIVRLVLVPCAVDTLAGSAVNENPLPAAATCALDDV